ncbi:glycosyltransferase family 4 protein [Truepera radiovictrix]|nr:glycosyltransferase family 4 protein [Truepera radiovictrix]WMT56279.1 glycosyltransferase family 4 protein [Truepera radiovictrix]
MDRAHPTLLSLQPTPPALRRGGPPYHLVQRLEEGGDTFTSCYLRTQHRRGQCEGTSYKEGEPVNRSSLRKIAVIGNYPPRQCGIATFTADLVGALGELHGPEAVFAVAMNDTPEGYAYPPVVRFELPQGDLSHYARTADFLNLQDVDVVNVQHEFGIFGGESGSHLLTLLRDLKAPVVTTLHTVLEHPTPQQRLVIEELAALSERLVVMSEKGRAFLGSVYGIPETHVDLIPHGIPDVPFTDPTFYKDRFGVEDRTVLLTFGLLSPNKGLEHAIRALPRIVERHPDVLYLIVGATHPHLKRKNGESYRLSLQRLARTLGVEHHVVFYDRFVALDELLAFIGAADVYLTPYVNREQIVSGTLAYALGAGKAVISTPYWYAEELLAEGRGRLTPFADPDALAENVLAVLDNAPERNAMRKRAYLYGREMIWPAVAARYTEVFGRARERSTSASQVALPKPLGARPPEFPPLDLRHLERLSDDTGILQHAVHAVPNYNEGYTTDDNARALIAGVMLEAYDELSERVRRLTPRYLAFLHHAFDPATRRFRNFMAYDRTWLEPVGSEDAHGRALWALGTVLGSSQDRSLRGVAGALFERALPGTLEFTSPRAWAFTLLGVASYLERFAGDRSAQGVQEALAGRLVKLYRDNASPAWPWFEPLLSYCNAKLPHALITTGQQLAQRELLEIGLQSLDWLMQEQKPNGHFSWIGCNGFYPRGGVRATFDQQPVEAHAMVSACLAAHAATGDARFLKEARCAFEWFLGENDLGLPLFDPTTGGCFDGLQPDRVNQNQGAESTLAFLLSLLELRRSSLPPTLAAPNRLTQLDADPAPPAVIAD